MTRQEQAPSVNHRSRPPRRSISICPRRHCRGTLVRSRDGDYVTITCMACGRSVHDQYRPTTLAYEVRLPPQAFEAPPTRTSKPRPKPTLDVPEPELTNIVERYCDLRRRGFTQKAIRAKMNWPRHYPSLLLEEARKREIPDAQVSQAHAFEEWLLTAHDAGADLDAIQRRSGYTPQQTKRKLAEALDEASRPNHDPLDVAGRPPPASHCRRLWTRRQSESSRADYRHHKRPIGWLHVSLTGHAARTTGTTYHEYCPRGCCGRLRQRFRFLLPQQFKLSTGNLLRGVGTDNLDDSQPWRDRTAPQ